MKHTLIGVAAGGAAFAAGNYVQTTGFYTGMAAGPGKTAVPYLVAGVTGLLVGMIGGKIAGGGAAKG